MSLNTWWSEMLMHPRNPDGEGESFFDGQGRRGPGGFIGRALGDSPIAALIASVTATAFVSACLFNIGYVLAWSEAGLLLFTPGDYVSLSIPLMVIIGVIVGAIVVFGPPAVLVTTILALVAVILNWRENLLILAILLGYIILLTGIFFLSRWRRRRQMKKNPVEPITEEDEEQRAAPPFKAGRWYLMAKATKLTSYLFILVYGPFFGWFFLVSGIGNVMATSALMTLFQVCFISFVLFVVMSRIRFSPVSFMGVFLTSVLISMPFTGYSLFVSQWENAKAANEVTCPQRRALSGDAFPGSCVLRTLERGLLLSDPASDQIIYESADGYRVSYDVPVSFPAVWAELLIPHKEGGNAPSNWIVNHALARQKRRDEHLSKASVAEDETLE